MQAGSVSRFFTFWRRVFSDMATWPSSARNHTSDTWG